MSRVLIWSTAAGIVIALTLPLRQAHAQRLSTEALVSNAATICEGRVLSFESAWNGDRGLIYTTIEIAVSATYKGGLSRNTISERPGGVLRLRLLGGEVGDVGMAVPHQAIFQANEQVILFLNENTQSPFPLFGDEQGKLTVVADATAGESIIRERNVSRAQFIDEVVRRVRGR